MLRFLHIIASVVMANLKIPIHMNENLEAHSGPIVQASVFPSADTYTYNNYINNEYYMNIHFGSTKQAIRTSFSSGNAYSWVSSTSCPTTQCRQTRYNPSASVGTYTALNIAGTLSYETGSVLGKYVTDQMCVSNDDNNCVTGFKFLAVENTSNMPTI